MEPIPSSIRIAHLSPSHDAYSETFIQNRGRRFIGEVLSYYGGRVPTFLDGKGEIKNYTQLDEQFLSLCKKYPSLESVCFFRQSLLDEKANIVYAEYGTTAAECLPAIKSLKLPLIVHFLGFDATSRVILSKYGRAYKEVFGYSQKIITVSKSISSALIDLGCPEEKLLCVPSAAEDAFFRNAPEFRSRTVLAVGRFVHKKGPQYTILAFKEVLKKFPDAQLRMIGEGYLLEACKRIVDGFKLGNQVVFLGSQSHERVRFEMEQSSLFVQHSLTSEIGDQEGMPTSIVEASAAALPVVTTRHAGIPEAIKQGETGYMVEEYDIAGMADRICQILENPTLARDMGARARLFAQQHFTLDRSMTTINQCLFSAQGALGSGISEDNTVEAFLSCKSYEAIGVYADFRYQQRFRSLEDKIALLKERSRIKNIGIRAITFPLRKLRMIARF